MASQAGHCGCVACVLAVLAASRDPRANPGWAVHDGSSRRPFLPADTQPAKTASNTKCLLSSVLARASLPQLPGSDGFKLWRARAGRRGYLELLIWYTFGQLIFQVHD
jgi:hypothetical protein